MHPLALRQRRRCTVCVSDPVTITPRGPVLTCPPGVAEVTLHHTTGLAIPAADSTPVFFGCRPDDAITADFLENQRAGFACVVRFSDIFKQMPCGTWGTDFSTRHGAWGFWHILIAIKFRRENKNNNNNRNSDQIFVSTFSWIYMYLKPCIME